MKRWFALFLLFLLSACGAVNTQVSKTTAAAASGVVAQVTAPATQEALQKTASETVAAAVAPATAAMEKTVVVMHDGAVQTATDARNALLNPSIIDDAADDARERLLGAPLRADVDALIADAEPKLADAVAKILAPIQVDAANTAQTFKEIAIGLAVGVGVMVVALAVALWEIYRHRRYLAELTASIAARHAATKGQGNG